MAKRKTQRQAGAGPKATSRPALSARARAMGFPTTDESPRRRKARAGRVVDALRRAYPDATIALAFSNPVELLVATILSAQCTDDRVNQITRTLFKKYRSAPDYAEADTATFEQEIHAAGFFRQKTASIQGACRQIVDRHGGRVPDTMAELTGLEGVARKTANVILSQAFGKNEGIVVDTHVGRVALRLALAPSARDDKDAVRVEKDLMAVVAQDEWGRFADAVVWHGRRVCTARRPDCAQCPIAKHCPSAFKVKDPEPKTA